MQVTGGDTNVTTYFVMRLTATGVAATGLTPTDFDLQYVRTRTSPTGKVDASDLVSTSGAHTDYGVVEVNSATFPGLYRVDWPDAAFAAGVPEVVLSVTVATAFAEHMSVLIDAPVDVAGIADAVWDEILTGGTHNIATSAGRRLRELLEAGGYDGAAVWIDTVNGAAGTEDFVNGLSNNPVNSIADAKTIADSVGLKRFRILSGSSFTLAATFDGYEFRGEHYTVALGGQSVSGTHIQGAAITGNDDGTNAIETHYHACEMGNNTLGMHHLDCCELGGDIVLAEAADYIWNGCYSGIAGSGSPSVDFESAAETKSLSIRHYSGGMTFKNLGAGGGTHTATLEGVGQYILDASCAGGDLAPRGVFKRTDNASGAVTEDLEGLINLTTLESEASDALIALKLDHLVAVAESDDPVDDSIIAKMVSKEATANWSSFVNTTESLQALKDLLTTDLQTLQNSTSADVHTPVLMERPPSGDELYPIHMYLETSQGSMGVPDSLPTVTAVNDAGTSRSTNLSAVSTVDTGHYSATYKVNVADPIEQVHITWSVTENGATKTYGGTIQIVDLTLLQDTIDDVETDTGDIQGRLPAALSSGNMKADALAINGSTAAAAQLAISAATIVDSTAKAGTLSTTQMSTNLTEATDDHYNGRSIIWTSGVLINQASDITDYVGVNGVLTFTAVTEAPSASDSFIIV